MITWQQELLVARAPVDPLCTEGTPQICVWPEQRRFLGELDAMAAGIRTLDVPGLAIPTVIYEEGLRPADESPGLFLAGGNPWMIASGLASEVLIASLDSPACIPQGKEDQIAQASLELIYWLTLTIAGSPQPDTVHGGPDVDRSMIEQFASSPLPEQHRGARQRLDILTRPTVRDDRPGLLYLRAHNLPLIVTTTVLLVLDATLTAAVSMQLPTLEGPGSIHILLPLLAPTVAVGVLVGVLHGPADAWEESAAASGRATQSRFMLVMAVGLPVLVALATVIPSGRTVALVLARGTLI
ncbi:MAG: DUF7224 domain-containing protein [Candidatus Nanopelagicales bacterium]